MIGDETLCALIKIDSNARYPNGCNVGQGQWNRRVLPVAEAGDVELLGGVGAVEHRFGEDATGLNRHDTLVALLARLDAASLE